MLLGFCSLVTKLCLTLGDPMDCSMPVLHYLLEFAQTHIHWVDDAIQPSHPLSSLSPPAFNLFQGFFPMIQYILKGRKLDLAHEWKFANPCACSLEGLMLKLKLQYSGHLMQRTGKNNDVGKDWRQEEKGMTEDKMVGWHHRLNGHGFGWTLGVGDGQGGLVCCSPWVTESDTTERLNWNEGT